MKKEKGKRQKKIKCCKNKQIGQEQKRKVKEIYNILIEWTIILFTGFYNYIRNYIIVNLRTCHVLS